MTSALRGRLRRLERTDRVAEYVVIMPEAAWQDDALWDAVIAAHRERTGYLGPVMVSPEPCDTEEEWIRRHGRAAA